MAQYMNYYKFPKHGMGEESVTVKYDQGDVILHVDFEQATYDWDNMIDNYEGEYTYEQGQAVAQLCYHCGVAAQTTWNSLGGGTNDQRIVEAFTKHFNYNDAAHYIPRTRYDEPTWMEMMYGMLSSGNPILYSAKDINLNEGILVGHNFIIDDLSELIDILLTGNYTSNANADVNTDGQVNIEDLSTLIDYLLSGHW